MARKPPMTPERRADLERMKGWVDRLANVATELLDTLTDEPADLPPMALPADFNGWLALRYQARAMGRKIGTELGYNTAEIRADLGQNIGNKTLRDVIRFALKRRLKPRYDEPTNSIVLDGPEQVCKTAETLDGEV